MSKTKLYVCPVCGNVINSIGEAVISCCGIILPLLEIEKTDATHQVHIEIVEDEYYVAVNHEMIKEHYISFMAAISDNGIHIVKLYPEGEATARFKIGRTKKTFSTVIIMVYLKRILVNETCHEQNLCRCKYEREKAECESKEIGLSKAVV